MKAQQQAMVTIEFSDDDKKWFKAGTFLDIDRALLSLTWSKVKMYHKYYRMKRGKKVIL